MLPCTFLHWESQCNDVSLPHANTSLCTALDWYDECNPVSLPPAYMLPCLAHYSVFWYLHFTSDFACALRQGVSMPTSLSLYAAKNRGHLMSYKIRILQYIQYILYISHISILNWMLQGKGSPTLSCDTQPQGVHSRAACFQVQSVWLQHSKKRSVTAEESLS